MEADIDLASNGLASEFDQPFARWRKFLRDVGGAKNVGPGGPRELVSAIDGLAAMPGDWLEEE